MNEGKIAVRYSKALFLTAVEGNILEPVKLDILLISEVIRENQSFRDFLYSPISKPSDRSRLLNIAFGEGRVQKITSNFLEILVQNNRIHYIEGIIREFFTIYRKNLGIKSATLVTAVELNLEYQQKFQAVLKNIYKAEIELSLVPDSSIIGGFILTVEDQQYDASIAKKLKKMKTALLNDKLN
jgi:F-type H+-transporting ATPase subunit delta